LPIRASSHARTRLPSEDLEADSTACVEAHAVAAQEFALHSIAAWLLSRTHLAARVEHALPRNSIVVERGERITDEARLARQPRELGDLAIGRDAASWDAPNNRIDARVRGRARQGRSNTTTGSPTRTTPGSITRQ
jgi:hypothetical protein